MASTDLDLLRGTLDLLLLKALSREPMHGLGVTRWIEKTTHQKLMVEEGALYPALHRLEERGWLEAEWGYTDKGRRAKYYQLTAVGRRRLATEMTKWASYSEAVRLVLTAEGNR